MTLDTNNSKAVFQGNGTATVFPFDFKVWKNSQIVVTIADNDGTSMDVTANCSIALTESGGTVTYLKDGAPLPVGYTLAITRNMPFVQGVDLVSATRFDPQVIEDALDQATAERQQLAERLARAVVVETTSSLTPEDLVQSIYTARDEAKAAGTAAGQSAAQAATSADEAGAAAAAATAQADRAKAEADRAQALTEVGPATAEKLGMVKVGTGIAVTEDGTISTEKITTGATLQTDEHGLLNVGPHAFENPEICGKGDFQKYGHVRLTDNPDENAGAVAGMAASPVALRTAVARILDVSEDVTVTTSGTYAVPFTGAYSITAVGGGGNGGNDSGNPFGGRGGGGGAGQVSTISRQLTKGQEIPIVIGGSGGGQTSVGDFLTAAGGGNGGNGQPGNYSPWHGTGNMGAPGAAGFSYGTPASPGGNSGTAATGGTSAFPPYGNGGNGGTLISAPSNVLPPTPGTSGCVRITLTKLGG